MWRRTVSARLQDTFRTNGPYHDRWYRYPHRRFASASVSGSVLGGRKESSRTNIGSFEILRVELIPADTVEHTAILVDVTPNIC